MSEMWFARDFATYVAGPFSDPAIGLRLAIGTSLRRRSLRRG